MTENMGRMSLRSPTPCIFIRDVELSQAASADSQRHRGPNIFDCEYTKPKKP